MQVVATGTRRLTREQPECGECSALLGSRRAALTE